MGKGLDYVKRLDGIFGFGLLATPQFPLSCQCASMPCTYLWCARRYCLFPSLSLPTYLSTSLTQTILISTFYCCLACFPCIYSNCFGSLLLLTAILPCCIVLLCARNLLQSAKNSLEIILTEYQRTFISRKAHTPSSRPCRHASLQEGNARHDLILF